MHNKNASVLNCIIHSFCYIIGKENFQILKSFNESIVISPIKH